MLIVDREETSRRELLWSLAGVGGCACMAPSCAYNQATGRNQFILVSEGQIEQLSSQAWDEVRRRETVSRSPAAQRRVNGIGSRIVTATGGDPREWDYVAFESEQLNAFALPGGRVGVYTGLMDLTDSDDELATVVGHEVAHVYARHSAERTSRQLVLQGVPLVAGAALAIADVEQPGLIVAALGAGVTYGLVLPFSRSQELEADRLGLRYMHAARYEAEAAPEFWRKMNAASGGGGPPTFLSTHPGPDQRIRVLEAEIEKL